MGSARRVAEESIDHLIPPPPFDKYLDERIITLIRRHLERHEFFRPWGDSPRLYALLRMLQCDESAVLQFQNASINDFWLPIDETIFNIVGTNIDWEEFRRMQRRVLTNHELMSEAELLATPDVHRHLEYDFYFKEGKHLGTGASARVFQVQHISLDNRKGGLYACKRATRLQANKQREQIQLFINELEILRHIRHPHLVQLVTSYTDTSNFALILSPVADESLKEMLNSATVPLPKPAQMLLLRSFACLISALSYLHTEGIRHKDIKPGNIVLSKGQVYLCDFGVSNDWTGDDPVTEGPTHRTPGYSAPEVSNWERRTDAQDIWSMGRVFCEIFTVTAGRKLEDLFQHLGSDVRNIYEERGIASMNAWISELDIAGAVMPSAFLRQTIQSMMNTDPATRPKAKQLLTGFGENWVYIDDCCQEAYGRPGMTLLNRPYSQHHSPQRLSQHSLHYNSMQGASQQLGIPLQLQYNGNVERTLCGQSDLTLPPNSRVPSQRSTDEDTELVATTSNALSNIQSDRHSSLADHRTSLGHSSAVWSSGSAVSPNQNPRLSSVSRAERQNSFGASSIRSHRCVKWSRGPVPSRQLNYIVPSTTCNCAPRKDRHQVRERLILSSTDVKLSNNVNQPTIEVTDCNLHHNTVHVYESYSRQSHDKYRVWLKTRRLVVSKRSGATDIPQCHSFWLPLTDIASAVEGKTLTLRWSDCNQWRTSPLRNNKQSCNCIYDPDLLNNGITLAFLDSEAAMAFLNSLCEVYNDCDDIKEWRNVEVVDQQRLLVVDVQDTADIAYRIACLATYKSATFSTFQVFIHWSDIDLDIRIESSHTNDQHSMVIGFDQVSTLNYTSNVLNEPWVDKLKVARCAANDLVIGAYSMAFPYEADSLSRIPDGVEQMLEYLTGWTICFFAPNVQLAKDKLIWDTNYGLSDVMLWTRYQTVSNATTPEVKITFRHRRARPNYVWRSASVNFSASPIFSLTSAAFTVTHKAHGDKLHTPTMTAAGKTGPSPSSDKLTKLGLQFGTSEDLEALMKVFNNLQKAGRRDSLTKVPTNGTLARGSKDFFRRHPNTSQ